MLVMKHTNEKLLSKMIIVTIVKRGKRDKIIILEIYFLHKFYVFNNKLIN